MQIYLDPSRISDLLMLQVMECLRAKGGDYSAWL